MFFRQFQPKRNKIVISFDSIGLSTQRECNGGCTPAVNGGSAETQNKNWKKEHWTETLVFCTILNILGITQIPNIAEVSYRNFTIGEYWNTEVWSFSGYHRKNSKLLKYRTFKVHFDRWIIEDSKYNRIIKRYCNTEVLKYKNMKVKSRRNRSTRP